MNSSIELEYSCKFDPPKSRILEYFDNAEFWADTALPEENGYAPNEPVTREIFYHYLASILKVSA